MKKLILTTIAMLATLFAGAVELPDVFSDNMVLQQQTKARIWGWAKKGTTITVKPSWNNATYTAKAGKDGRWETQMDTPEASYTQYTIDISENGSNETTTLKGVLIGEVWFCSGQSNMEMPLGGFWNCPVQGANEAIAESGKYKHAIRVCTVTKADPLEPADRVTGKWDTCEPKNAAKFSAVGYFFARTLNNIIDIPVGIINCSWGGSAVEGWMPKEILLTYPDGLVPMDDQDYHRKMVMYNGMLYPLAGYTIKGFLWNQGETNSGNGPQYIERFSTMVRHWRQLWRQPGSDLPIYAVELPAWRYGDADATGVAHFRVAQHDIEKVLDHYGCVSTTDLLYPYEMDQIHGTRKLEIGQRLAYMAATRDYGVEGIGSESPRFEYMEKHEATAQDKQVIAGTAVDVNPNEKGIVYHLYFSNSEDGFDMLSDIDDFEVLGNDGKWHHATVWADSAWQNVKRQGCFLKLVCPEAGEVNAVRYAFHNGSIGKLHNLRGLPVVPFTTEK